MPVPSRSSSYAGRRSPPSGPSFASEHVRSPLLFVSQYSKSSLVCAATSMGSARAQSPNVTMRRTERGTCRDLIGVARDGLQGDFHRRTRRAPPPRHRNRRVATAHSGADSRTAPVGRSGVRRRVTCSPRRGEAPGASSAGGRPRGGLPAPWRRTGRNCAVAAGQPCQLAVRRRAPPPSNSRASASAPITGRHRHQVRDDREPAPPPRSGCRPRPARPRPRCPPSRRPRPRA